LDVLVILQNQSGDPVVGMVRLHERTDDPNVGVKTPGVTVWIPLEDEYNRVTGSSGMVLFEDRKAGKFSLMVIANGYLEHWEVFLARKGPVFKKKVTLTARTPIGSTSE